MYSYHRGSHSDGDIVACQWPVGQVSGEKKVIYVRILTIDLYIFKII